MDSTTEARLLHIFKDLHECPERGWEEIQTTAYLIDFLQKEGLKPQPFSDMTGLYVDVGEGEPTVGFRTDIDGLWQEVHGAFQANHSCGHDGHMTVALGVVLQLQAALPQDAGAVRIIFQPAEETGQGAKAMLEKGIVDSLDFLYGAHVRPLTELADGAYAPAIQHGAAKMLEGEITGIEAHGARPEEGINAIEVASALVEALKRFWIASSASGSIKMTQLQAGGASGNIVPGNATFRIDIRAQENETMETLTAGLKRAMDSVTALYGVTITTTVTAEMAAAQTNAAAEAIVQQAITEIAGKSATAEPIVTPGGEDFHFYSYARPDLHTTMLGIGCGVTPGLHHPEMTFNRERLPVAAEIMTRALLLTLEKQQESNAYD